MFIPPMLFMPCGPPYDWPPRGGYDCEGMLFDEGSGAGYACEGGNWLELKIDEPRDSDG
jgi:hypothetical protein